MSCLEDDLIRMTDVLEIDFPEREKWKHEYHEKKRKRPSIIDEMELYDREMSYWDDDELPISDEFSGLRMDATPNPAFVNYPSSMKVGRNDPCPCGSGKKYKKCCGKPH
jgi:preprotein translocase subunit SecA